MLSEIVNEEPVREVDKAWMGMLEPLGIAKGEEFAPDERQQEILKKAAAMGELMTRNIQVNPRYTEPYWKGTNWYKSFDFLIPQETETIQELDQRATWFYEAVSSTKGMVNPTPGAGQVYMTTKRDANGDLLRADKNYKLHVPADVPVKQFWSLTLYSENTRRPYDNGGTEISLEQPGPPLHDDATAERLRELITKGALNGLVFNTDDARGLYETLKARGVTDFTQEPTDHFYGTDMGIRDPFGNAIRILQQGNVPQDATA